MIIQQPYNGPVYAKPSGTIYTNYRSAQSMGLGITQIIIGVMCITFNGVALGYGAPLSYVGHGIWGGIMFIITGAFGIPAAKVRSKCLVCAFMVLCIISASLCVPVFSLGIAGAVSWCDYYWTCYWYKEIGTAMNSMLAVLAVAEAAVAIWGSVICCKVACCGNTPGNMMVPQPVQYTQGYGGQIITITHPPGQGVPFVTGGNNLNGMQGIQSGFQYNSPTALTNPDPQFMDARKTTNEYDNQGYP